MQIHKRSFLSMATIAILVVAYFVAMPFCRPFDGEAGAASRTEEPPAVIPGELLVKYREPMFDLGRRLVNDAVGASEQDQIEQLGVSRVALEPGVSLEEATRRFDAVAAVEYVEPNVYLETAMVPNDDFYVGRQEWYYDLIGAPKAWDAEMGDPQVVVAVLDTGVDVTHPDLKDNIWTNTAETAANGIDDDGNGCVDDVHGCNLAGNEACPSYPSQPAGDIDDDRGHGTFVAGVVAAKGNNSLGVTGIAPNVTIMPVKITDCQERVTSAALATAILYAAAEGAKVVNVSSGIEDPAEDVVRTLQAAIDVAVDGYGVTVVAAAGNHTDDVWFPASYKKVIAVSAGGHREEDSKAWFSSWGPEVTVTAPGQDIAGTLPSKFCGADWTCFGDKPYAIAEGTSFSTPLVSGAVALLLSSVPSLSPTQVKARLTATALDLPNGNYPNWDGAGRLQVDKLLEGKSFQVGASGIVRN